MMSRWDSITLKLQIGIYDLHEDLQYLYHMTFLEQTLPITVPDAWQNGYPVNFMKFIWLSGQGVILTRWSG